MPRPRRRCRGGRVTPKGTSPGERPSEWRPAATPVEDPQLVEMLLQDAADAAEECADLDEAEVWASSAQILFRPFGVASSPVLHASRALAAAEACPNRGAAAMVAASISAYGPPGYQNRAARLLQTLADSNAPLPGWIGSLGDVTPRRAALLTDAWDDERSVWVDFERADGEVRGVGVSVNGSQGAYARHFVRADPTRDAPSDVERVVEQAAPSTHLGAVGPEVERAGLADARPVESGPSTTRPLCRGLRSRSMRTDGASLTALPTATSTSCTWTRGGPPTSVGRRRSWSTGRARCTTSRSSSELEAALTRQAA